jgi:hypothetical protein
MARCEGESRWLDCTTAIILALLTCRVPTFAADKPTTTFRYSIKRPFPFDSQEILRLPDNPFIDSRAVIFHATPNVFHVTVIFGHRGPIDSKRLIVGEIRLLDDQGKAIAAQTYKCPDMRVDAGKEVMPGIRSSSLQSIDLSHCEKKLKDRVAEVAFLFKDH